MTGARPRRVRTLVGDSTLAASLTCLPTLVRFSADPVRVVVHDDGTLTAASRATLRAAVLGIEIVDRARADEEVGDRLARHPRCRVARSSNFMFLKMFDVALLEPGDLAYCDSDVLFLRPFDGLFGPPDPRFPFLFMTDAKEAYAVRPWHLRPLGKLKLASRVNAGLMRVWAGALDLDFVEWLLGRMGSSAVWKRRWYWNEQTCWAALGGRSDCGLWDARQVVMATRDMASFTSDAVAVHFVSTYRFHLPEYAGRAWSPTAVPVRVASRPARRVGPIVQFIADSRGRLS
jgi:hypothetical protein